MTNQVDVGALEKLLGLRQHQASGRRSPHKPLLVLLALGRFAGRGNSAVRWDEDHELLGGLIEDFGPPSRTSSKQAAAYPFARLRSDGVWELDRDVPMDRSGPLDSEVVTGRLSQEIEDALVGGAVFGVARSLVEAHFPASTAPDVLLAAGFAPEHVLTVPGTPSTQRRRSASWPALVLRGWDECCAFCGYDGRLGRSTVGLDAAHIRWFNHGGPDDPENGLALCTLHHRLFDRGVLGLDDQLGLVVSESFTARSDTGRQVYRLHGRRVRPRPGSAEPAAEHLAWHRREVFARPSLPVLSG